MEEQKANPNEIVWKDRKRIIFGLPWTFTRYSLTQEKLLVDTGFFNRKEDEVRLYRILDISLKRPLSQRIWGLGTVHLCTADKSTPDFDIKRIKNSRDFKNMLSDMVERERNERRISGREYMGIGSMDGDMDMDMDDMHL
ncbi:MAG: PH domain-containing protein [Eubacteriales bacterium]|nr:PH domain-containing protein [Eubacteriales bacterium]